MHKIIVRGVVVGKGLVGEGSTRVLIYTDALGLVSAFAKSGREERSQLRAHLELGTTGSFWLVKGERVWRLTGVSKTNNLFFALSDQSEGKRSLARVLSFVRQFVRGEGSDPYFFGALWNFTAHLSVLRPEEIRDAECVTVLRMLAALGYVEDSSRVSPFLNLPYTDALFTEARKARSPLLKVINDGITASGLT